VVGFATAGTPDTCQCRSSYAPHRDRTWPDGRFDQKPTSRRQGIHETHPTRPPTLRNTAPSLPHILNQGNRYVAVEVSITNPTDETQSFSTLLYAELIDSQNQTWDASIFGLSDRPGLDVDIPSGETRQGWIAFEVPEASSGFRLRLKGSITADRAIFTLS
jgi:hypothetical protein